jgi:hypothetical protein
MWWSFSPSYYITNLLIIIVCFYYFLRIAHIIPKILLAFSAALAGAGFVCGFYPPWEVPFGYIFLVIFAYIIITNIDLIKKLMAKDWIIIISAFIFMLSVILVVIIERSDYIDAIGQTVYPGKRRNYGGGASPASFFYAFQSFLYPFINVGNPSELSSFFVIFPLSFFSGMYIWFIRKRDNVLILLLNILSFFFFYYITIGFPYWFGKVTFMNFATSSRIMPAFLFLQLIVMLLVINKNKLLLNNKLATIPAGAISVFLPVYFCLKNFPDYMTKIKIYIVLMSIIYFIGGCIMSVKCSKKVLIFFQVSVISIVFASSLVIHPIMKGLDVIYSKPAAIKIKEIVKNSPNAIWISSAELTYSGFLVACGAPTLNSVNYIPNMEMWHKLDPEGKYEEIYNRYSHIIINLTKDPTEISLIQADLVSVSLSFSALKKLDVQYIFTPAFYESNEFVSFELLYSEYGTQIYKVLYPDI